MYMTPISSSNLRSVGYDPATQTLRIQFKNATYDYFDVPEHIYQALMSASSHGSYHAKYIKDDYRNRRL